MTTYPFCLLLLITPIYIYNNEPTSFSLVALNVMTAEHVYDYM